MLVTGFRAVIFSAAMLTTGLGQVEACGAENDRFVWQFGLNDGKTLVVAEGDREPRSIGSYTVRIYDDLTVGALVAGVVRPRNGFVQEVKMRDLDRDGREEIIIRIETAGSGPYVALNVFTFDGKQLRWSETLSRPM